MFAIAKDAAHFQNRIRALLQMLIVFLPVPTSMILAASTRSRVIALAGVPLSVLFAWGILRMNGSTWPDVGLKKHPKPLTVIKIVVSGALLILAVCSLLNLLLRLVHLTPDAAHFDAVRGSVPALLIGLAIVWTSAAFGEEMVFRGFLLNGLRDLIYNGEVDERSGWIAPVLLCSLVFGLCHSYQGIAGVISTGTVGLITGLIYVYTGRKLWPCILIHGLIDTVGFIAIFFSLERYI